MKKGKFSLMLILILLSTILNAQFTVDELQQIRLTQIEHFACEKINATRAVKMAIQNAKIQRYELAIQRYRSKDEIFGEQVQYYRETIRDKDIEIKHLNRKVRAGRLAGSGSVALSIILGTLFILK